MSGSVASKAGESGLAEEPGGRGLRRALILGSAIGLTTGMPATMFYSLGTFIPSLTAEFGWSRWAISAAVTIMTVGLFLAGPFTGRLCDRYGAASVGAATLAAYGSVTIAMALLLGTLPVLYAFYFVIALLGTGSTSIVLVRPVIDAFRAHRGLALGLALTGAGMAAFWVPIATQAAIAWSGWRFGYAILGASAILAAPIVWLTFRPFERVRHASAARPAPEHGLSAREARRTARFWLLSAVTLAMAAGVAGLVFHLVPLLRDLGADAVTAARLASIVGLASTAGRLVIGYLLDRLAPALVAGVVLTLSALGAAMLWRFGLEGAWIAAALLGLAAGAEVDLIAFLTARYFGRRAYGAIYGCAYGAIYGWQYSVFALGYGFAPLGVGALHDLTGTYDGAMLLSAFLVGVAAAGMFALARRNGAGERYAALHREI